MPSARSIDVEVDDGIIRARSLHLSRECENCHSMTTCLKVLDVRLPQGITASTRLILYKTGVSPDEKVDYLGLSCGCYAKAHRQIAHIRHSEGFLKE